MPYPTYDQLNAVDVTLFELTEWADDMRTWERRVVSDVRALLRDRMKRLKEEKAAIPGEEKSGQTG